MSVSLKDTTPYTITDFSGGLNEFPSSFKIANNELVACKNISLRDSGGIKNRMGETRYALTVSEGGPAIVTAVKGMYRYTKIDGTKSIIQYAGKSIGAGNFETDHVYADDDAGLFSEIGRITTNDGWLRFAQFRDTLFYGTDRENLKAYDPDYSASQWEPNVENAVGWPFVENVLSDAYTDPTTGEVITGNLDTGGYYYYRYTFDYGGVDFLGESSPLVFVKYDKARYQTFEADLTSPTDANEGFVAFSPLDFYGSGLPDGVQGVNIYRSVLYASSINNYSLKEFPVHYIGSVSKELYETAGYSSVIPQFYDLGQVPGQLAEYHKMTHPPRPRFITYHRGRMFYANVVYNESSGKLIVDDGDYLTAPHRVFFSHINNSGNQEPIVVYSDSWVDIDPTSGEGITGMISYMGELLIIFKAFRVRTLSPTVGCVAPETIQVVDGRLVWLSHSGVYYYDGSIPKTLKSDNIYDTLNAIPTGLKKDACSIYDVDRREYLMAHAGDDSTGYNTFVSKLDLRSGSWSTDKYVNGISSFVQKRNSDESVTTLAGLGTLPAIVLLRSNVIKLNSGWGEMFEVNSGNEFSFQTKFFDLDFPFMNKDFRAVLVELKSSIDLTLHVRCDSRLDTNLDSGGGFTIQKPTGSDLVWWDTPDTANMKWNSVDGTQNANVWALIQEAGSLVALDQRCWGKRISFEIVGTPLSEVDIQSITVFYKQKEGIRE
jgi:hypothetical protein